jgi:hypothetical protein
MYRIPNEFKCNSDTCENWVPHSIVIAETEQEFKTLRMQVPIPFAECNGILTKQFDCTMTYDGQKCPGKVNINYVKKVINQKDVI